MFVQNRRNSMRNIWFVSGTALGSLTYAHYKVPLSLQLQAREVKDPPQGHRNHIELILIIIEDVVESNTRW